MPGGFREHLFGADDPRVASIRGLTARQYAEAATTDSFAGPMIEGWAKLYPEPFVGITNAGTVDSNVFSFGGVRPDEHAPTPAMVAAANRLLGALSPSNRAKVLYPLTAHEWRSWANPEFMQHDTGLRLDELDEAARRGCLAVIEASLSTEGFQLVQNLMRINGFLGDVVELPLLMNEFSYNFAIFGDPSTSEPWGWHLFGHHVGVNCVVAGPRMVISPSFLGAEPDTIDEGEHRGVRVFDERIDLARRFMASLAPQQRQSATLFDRMVDPAMPAGSIHSGDERHLGGCFQDNRVVPYEGILLDDLTPVQQKIFSALVAEFLVLLPAGPRAARLREIEAYRAETWFSWIGGWEGQAPFYFRLQSPVAMLELDHHTGVFLTNTEPAAFHIHTVLRTPNGNDYGRALIEYVTGSPFEELPA